MCKLHSVKIKVENTEKEIAVFCDDITRFEAPIDILTTSAFENSYVPSPGTVFRALYHCGIDVRRLAYRPAFDLRNICQIWLSEEIDANADVNIKRIGCIELISTRNLSFDQYEREQSMINSIRSYFLMLDIAALYGVSMDTIALPLLGSGNQGIDGDGLLIPLINECISFLKRNHAVQNIYFIDKNLQKTELITQCLNNSLRFLDINTSSKTDKAPKDIAFISYSSGDKNIADNLCSKLENKGIRVWYAPRDVRGPYAEAIVKAIGMSGYFIVILSQNSIMSEHVLNEIDLAFQDIPKGMKFKPLRIDKSMLTPSFKYYLSRQHWMDATDPPLEERLNEFVNEIVEENRKASE